MPRSSWVSTPERWSSTCLPSRRAGLAVEDVLEVEVLPEPAPSPGGPHLSGAALVDGEAVGVLDVESVLASAGVQS
jgi:hypothetical protein